MCRLSGRYQQYALSGLGEGYVKDFIDRGRVKRVYMQGDAAGVSTGSAMAQMSDLVSYLNGFDFQWSGLSWQP